MSRELLKSFGPWADIVLPPESSRKCIPLPTDNVYMAREPFYRVRNALIRQKIAAGFPMCSRAKELLEFAMAIDSDTGSEVKRIGLAKIDEGDEDVLFWILGIDIMYQWKPYVFMPYPEDAEVFLSDMCRQKAKNSTPAQRERFVADMKLLMDLDFGIIPGSDGCDDPVVVSLPEMHMLPAAVYQMYGSFFDLCEANFGEMVKYWNVASALEYPPAFDCLRVCYIVGDGVPIDEEISEKLSEKGIIARHANCIRNKAVGNPDPEMEFQYYIRACTMGHMLSLANYITFLLQHEIDEALAVRLRKFGAKFGEKNLLFLESLAVLEQIREEESHAILGLPVNIEALDAFRERYMELLDAAIKGGSTEAHSNMIIDRIEHGCTMEEAWDMYCKSNLGGYAALTQIALHYRGRAVAKKAKALLVNNGKKSVRDHLGEDYYETFASDLF